jgi:hypothetical protein
MTIGGGRMWLMKSCRVGKTPTPSSSSTGARTCGTSENALRAIWPRNSSSLPAARTTPSMRHVGESSTATTSREPPRLGCAESIRAPGGACAREERPGVDSTRVRTVRWGLRTRSDRKGGTRRSSATSRSSGQTRTRAEQGLLQAWPHDPRGPCHDHSLILGHRRDEPKREMSCPSPLPSEEAPSSVVALELHVVVDSPGYTRSPCGG